LGQYLDRVGRKSDANDAQIRLRVLDAVKRTSGAAIDQIGKKGWYTVPDEPLNQLKAGTLFSYILRNENLLPVTIETIFSSQEFTKAKDGNDQNQIQYWSAWKQMEDDDAAFRGTNTLEEAISSLA
jgi:hypothetical protein